MYKLLNAESRQQQGNSKNILGRNKTERRAVKKESHFREGKSKVEEKAS